MFVRLIVLEREIIKSRNNLISKLANNFLYTLRIYIFLCNTAKFLIYLVKLNHE